MLSLGLPVYQVRLDWFHLSSYFSFSMKKKVQFVVLPCFDLGLTVPMYIHIMTTGFVFEKDVIIILLLLLSVT